MPRTLQLAAAILAVTLAGQSSALWADTAKQLKLPAGFEGGALALQKLTEAEMVARGFGIGTRIRVRKWQASRREAGESGKCPAGDASCAAATASLTKAEQGKKATGAGGLSLPKRGSHTLKYEQQAAKVDSGLEGYHWDDPFAQHSQAAEMFDEIKDLERLVLAWRGASTYKRNPQNLLSLGHALTTRDKARRLRQRKPLQALAALHESRMEAIRYGNYDNRMVPDWARTWQTAHESYASFGKPLPKYMVETEKEASRVLEDEQMDFTRPLWRGKIKDLIAFECTDEKLRVHVGDINKDRRKHDRQLDHAASVLAACGVVLLKNVIRKEHVQHMQDSAAAQVAQYMTKEIKPSVNPRADCPDCEAANVSVRSAGRWEFKVPFEKPWVDEETFNNLAVRGVMRRMVGRHAESRLEVDTYSVVTSLGKTPVQTWHGDVDAVFMADDFSDGSKVHLPPYGFVNFIPLASTPLKKGPTEYYLKSHMQCTSKDLHASFAGICAFCEEAGTWHATAEMGDAILFDLRTHHRGGQNKASTNRPQVYLTFMREDYIDAVNFRKFQTRFFDSLPQGAQKRLTRMDQIAYVHELEALVAKDRGHDFLRKMKSDPKNTQRYYAKSNQPFAYDEHAVFV